MTRRRGLRPDEKLLWEKVARTVSPLRGSASRAALDAGSPADATGANPNPNRPAKTVPPNNNAKAAPAKAPAASRSTPKELPTPGDLDRNLRRKLARGVEPIDGRLDLHGMTQAEAHGALNRFIGSAHLSGRRVVLVITGKGKGGEGAGILRRAVPHWLGGRELQRFVVSFGPAHITHGGDGALYVRLRSPQRSKRP